MSIDISSMSEEQLIELNHRVVERIKFLQQARAHEQMLEFPVGAEVSFTPDGPERCERTFGQIQPQDGDRYHRVWRALECCAWIPQTGGRNG